MIQEKVKIVLTGPHGRMGKNLIKEIKKNKKTELIFSFIKNEQEKKKEKIKQKVKQYTLKNFKNNSLNKFDVLIDFSEPNATIEYINFCVKNENNIIIGTTGFSNSQIKYLKKASEKIAILHAPNFSIGIYLLHQIIQKITKIFNKNTDIDIIDIHHRNKIDSPSGTALEIGKKIAKNMNWEFKKCIQFIGYEKITPRKKNKIGYSVIRSSDTIGKHTVLFSKKEEEIKIQHTAKNRSTFAKGAIQSAIWIKNKKKGLYSLKDIFS